MSVSMTAVELVKVRARPGVWVVGATWIATTLLFAFVVPFLVFLSLGGEATGSSDPEAIVRALLPGRLHETAASMYPMFGGAAMLVLGVLVSGGENRWNTWTLLLVQGPSRGAVVLGKACAAAVTALVIVLASYLAAAAASVLIAVVEGRPSDWPSARSLLLSIGAAWLISVAWTAVGLALGVVLRSATSAMAVGLVWTLGAESALSGIASVLPGLEPVRHLLLSVNSGSLVAALGAPSQSEGGVPGVVAVAEPLTAVAVLLAYTVASVAVATTVLRRRDIA